MLDAWTTLLRPLAFRLDPELAHELVGRFLDLAERSRRTRTILEVTTAGGDGRLGTRVFGLSFPSVLGVAGGFDKDARWVRALGSLGFGHAEIGTITPEAQAGNPRPRVFRLAADAALINRMGFPSAGASAVASRLRGLPQDRIPLLVSIGKNRATPADSAPRDYELAYRALAPYADVVTVNVSSPNTPGLRDLGVGEGLSAVLDAVFRAAREVSAANATSPRPLLVKISPDLSDEDLADAVALAEAKGVAGFVAVNTTLTRAGATGRFAREPGGLSGRPVASRALEVVRAIRRQTDGRLPIVGVGGVFTGRDAYRLIRAGASLIQAYTGFVYRGPTFARLVKEELRAELLRDGASTIAEVVGADA